MREHTRITPDFDTTGWCVHYFDGRGAWRCSTRHTSKRDAQKQAARWRRCQLREARGKM